MHAERTQLQREEIIRRFRTGVHWKPFRFRFIEEALYTISYALATYHNHSDYLVLYRRYMGADMYRFDGARNRFQRFVIKRQSYVLRLLSVITVFL